MFIDEEVLRLLIFRSDDFICFLCYGCRYEIILDENLLQLFIYIFIIVGLNEDLCY